MSLTRGLAVAFLFGLPASGCGGGQKGATSAVAQEELFKTGNFNYDEYFEDLYGYQANAHHAVEDEHTARMPLGKALGVGEAPLDKLLEQLTTVVNEQAQAKAHVHFKLDGVDEQGAPLVGKKITVTAAAKGRALPKDMAELTLAMDKTAKAEGQVWEKYGPLPDKGRRLAARAGELEGDYKSTFAAEPDAKRERVGRELQAAKANASELAGHADKAVKAATRFLKESRDLFETAANAEMKPPPGKSLGKGKGNPAPGKARDGAKPIPANSAPANAAPANAPAAKSEKPAQGAGQESSPDFNP
jgi:hypothetical protein